MSPAGTQHNGATSMDSDKSDKIQSLWHGSDRPQCKKLFEYLKEVKKCIAKIRKQGCHMVTPLLVGKNAIYNEQIATKSVNVRAIHI